VKRPTHPLGIDSFLQVVLGCTVFVVAGACATTASGVATDPLAMPVAAEAAPNIADVAAIDVAPAQAAAPTAEDTVATPVATAVELPSALPTPRAGAPARVVSRGREDRRAVTLTFDAGSDRGHAERILDVLAREHVTAAFGITGQWGAANPDLLARMAREGHALINHSYDHASFTGISWSKVARTREERARQLAHTEEVIRASAGATAMPYFRPPFGDYDASVLADAGALGYPVVVMWSVDSMGWRGWSAAQIVQRCLDGAHPGAIYIFHVGSDSHDGDALPAIIEGLHARDYEIVTLASLLGGP
jgi:peptidoglycan/xylan/chitin deacetylase (PgdA/CDA1 family)